MKKELNILLTAFLFYTRINVSKWVKYDKGNLSLSAKYLPVVGWVVGGVFTGVYLVSVELLSSVSAIIIAIITSVLVTGGFHEDGFADSCDGFGGGWEKSKILSIMKDSRIGVYGAICLILLFLLKISLLVQIYSEQDWGIILLLTISAHALSRFTAATFLFTHDYARDTSDSKSKDMAVKPPLYVLFVASVFTLIPLLLFSFYTNNYWLLLGMLPVYGCKILLGRYFQKWIQGYTGDALGATQQVTEVIYYISILGIWKFI